MSESDSNSYVDSDTYIYVDSDDELLPEQKAHNDKIHKKWERERLKKKMEEPSEEEEKEDEKDKEPNPYKPKTRDYYLWELRKIDEKNLYKHYWNEKYRSKDKKLDPDWDYAPRDSTLLMMACNLKCEWIAMELLENIDSCELEKHGGTYFQYTGIKTGYTALMFALKRGLEEPIRKMVNHLEKCNIYAKNHHGLTIMSWACHHCEDIKIKIFNAFPKTQCTINKMMYVSSKDLKLLNIIIDTVVSDSTGKLTMGIPNYNGRTLLMDIITNGHTETAMKMLQYPEKCGLDATNGFGNTALMIACYRSEEDIVLELLKNHKLCNLKAKNMKGITALDMMSSNRLSKALNFVMKNANIEDVIIMTKAQKEFLSHYFAKGNVQI